MHLVDDGGYGREGQNCIYRGQECSFEGTLPDANDTTHVDMTNIFASEGFKPLLEIKVQSILKSVIFIIQEFIYVLFKLSLFSLSLVCNGG